MNVGTVAAASTTSATCGSTSASILEKNPLCVQSAGRDFAMQPA